ncbi:hypothetical protein QVD17_32308 [Tagetes erecta]|uniref:Integrase catalytic domain-containing protein n=1 Tax=Tagetes erecta TaxID=13708 RepID=A0AAD8K9E5_TARER|nr:hypothetical protein QVD17_32308 [Tagetes erecta]
MGISHFTTPPHTPEQNGTAERRHRHVVETGLALLHFAGLPTHFWSHAFQTAVYLINRLPTPILDNKSPFQMLYGCLPTYSKLKPFGCECYPWLRPYTTSKLQPRSTKCIFLGYSNSKSAYKCLDPNTNRLYHSRHVLFIDHKFPFQKSIPHIPTPIPNPTPTTFAQSHIPTHTQPPQIPSPIPFFSNNLPHHNFLDNSTHNENPPYTTHTDQTPPSQTITPTQTDPTPTTSLDSISTRPTRDRKPNQKYFNSSFVNTTSVHPLPSTVTPTCVTQASKDPLWRKAMDDEYNALISNGTWDLVPAPIAKAPIGCKWVFRVKRKPDGSIKTYKARLVAKGFHQQYGRDYFDTFSPVTKPATIRIVLSLALSKGWPLRQLDINNAFLQGTLTEEVYMKQPTGYINQQFPNHVCRLRKSIYGLKQASRAWYMELTSFLIQFGFKKSLADASLFIFQQGKHIIYFMVYVDDIVLTGSHPKVLEKFISTLASRFSLKDLGMLHHFLGIEVIPTSSGLFLSQHRHIEDLLTNVKMEGAKDVTTPLCSTESLYPNDGSPAVDPTPYRQIIGSLQYLAFTRPDVSFAVNRLSQFMHAPTQKHWQALKRVLRYLKGTIYHGLFLSRGSPLTLTAFADSDWGGTNDGGRSTSAYLLYLGSNIISWRSSRQKSVSRSSTEAEYKALANAAAELSWVQNILQELGITLPHCPRLFCDNTGATYLCANPVYHSRMKHVALDYHFVRERVTSGLLQVFHINTADQPADVLTKPLSRGPFLKFRSKIGVSDGSSILRGRIKDPPNPLSMATK